MPLGWRETLPGRGFALLLGTALMAASPGVSPANGPSSPAAADTVSPAAADTASISPADSAATVPVSTAAAEPGVPFPDPAAIPAVDVIVVVRDFGEFRIALHRDEVPNHVAHFLSLVAEGFYDSLSFHRVIPGYLVQTGDPQSRDDDRSNDGAGSVSYRLPPEASERPIARGSVAMAWRGSEPGTSGSQWFVALGDFSEMTDGTVIGEVVEGMDTVDRISQVSTFRNRNPYRRVLIEDVRIARAKVGTPIGAPAASPPDAGVE